MATQRRVAPLVAALAVAWVVPVGDAEQSADAGADRAGGPTAAEGA